MSTTDYIESLKAKHATLEQKLSQETLRPHPDDDAICNLKKQKLLIRDRITRLSKRIH